MSDLNDPSREYRQPADLRHAEAILDSMLRGCTLVAGILMEARLGLVEKARRQAAAQAGPQPPKSTTRL